jgi:DNA-directed RNA polymerase specialized sigma subunit
VTGTYFRPGERTGLSGLSEEELLARCRGLPEGSGERAAIREVLVRRYGPVVRGCIRAYRASPEPTEDLMQVGYR